MTSHTYKIGEKWALDILFNNKRFEVRKDDRVTRPQVGDYVELICPDLGITFSLTVSYVLLSWDVPDLLPPQTLIFGFEDVCFDRDVKL